MTVLSLTGALAAASCDDGIESSQTYVALQELDQTQQPTIQPLGVLVDVASSGGNVVRLEVIGGTFANTNTSALCLNFGGAGLNTSVVSVVPMDTEALVNAYLGNRGASSGPDDAAVLKAQSADASDGAVVGTADAEVTLDASGPGPDASGAAAPKPAPPPFLDPHCAATDFVPLDRSSSLVVSIGRAPAPPIVAPDSSGANDATMGGGDADATLPTDAEAAIDTGLPDGTSTESAGDATTDGGAADAGDAGDES
jgi:hypothetical protein